MLERSGSGRSTSCGRTPSATPSLGRFETRGRRSSPRRIRPSTRLKSLPRRSPHDGQRQQKAIANGLPGAFGSQSPASDQAVQMWDAAPEYGPKCARRRSSPGGSKVARFFQEQKQSVSRGLEKRVGQFLEIPRPQRPELGRQCEDHMEVITGRICCFFASSHCWIWKMEHAGRSGRVEDGRGGCRSRESLLPVAFASTPVPQSRPWLRSPSPLIEPTCGSPAPLSDGLHEKACTGLRFRRIW